MMCGSPARTGSPYSNVARPSGAPGQLPHTALTLHSLDAEPLVEPLGAKTGDKQSDRSQKRFALLARETGVLPQEPLALGVGRHPPS